MNDPNPNTAHRAAATPYIPPPHSPEAELGVLSSAMQGGAAAIEECQARLAPEAFFQPSHAVLFRHLLGAYASQIPIDLVIFTQLLRDARELDELGGTIDGDALNGTGFLTRVFLYVPSAVRLEEYIGIVREKWMLRQMLDICTTTARRVLHEQDDTQSVLQDLQSNVIEVGQLASTHESLLHVSAIVPRVVENLEATYRNRGEVMGLPTGFVDLDRMLGGWMPARVHVIAARPAMGKTSLATEFAEYVALDAMEKKSAVAFFSVEMTSEELIESILLRRSRILLKKLRSGMFSKEERAELDAQAQELIESKLFVDETAGLSIFEFRARARRAVVKHGVRLIIIDYIGLMRGSQRVREKNREQEIAEIMQGIIDTAKEMKVAIIVLAQLNRETERTVSGVPKLADVRESGSIEQGAHFVGLLYRPSYYAKSEAQLHFMAQEREMSDDAFKEVAELIVAKNRRGPVGTVPLRFVKEFAHFESEDPDRPLYSNDQDERQRK